MPENAPLTDGAPADSDQPKKTVEKRPTEWTKYLRYVSLVVLVVQNTGQVLLTRYATRREQLQFIKTVAVFFNEVIKFSAALVLFFISTGDFKSSISQLKEHFITHWWDTLKVGVPAFIYTIQNFLLYLSIEHLDAGTYMVTYQLKILTTAIFTVLMLKRRLSIAQWMALAVLAGGVAIVQISAGKSSKEAATLANATLAHISTTVAPVVKGATQQQPWIGFLAVVTASVMSGFAGIYFEKILKGSEVSIWLRNVQLAFLSMPISLAVIAIKDRNKVMTNGFMQGFDFVVWMVICCQALGGLVVAVVIKYADNILKAFATSIAIVVACVASIFIFSQYPKILFLLGAALVIGAVVLYSVFPYRNKNPLTGEDVEANPKRENYQMDKLKDDEGTKLKEDEH